MPADILATDTLFPELNGKETTDQKFEMVTDYLWLLREQLTFALTNLGVANFNASQLQKLGNTLSEPFAVMIAEQDKKFAAFQVTIDGINGTISTLDETFVKQASFNVTSDGVKVSVASGEATLATVSQLTATSTSISAEISSVSKKADSAESTANSAKSTANSAKTTADNVSNNYISKSKATITATGFSLEVKGISSSNTEQTRLKITKDGLKIYNKASQAVFDFDTESGDLKVTGTITGSEIYGSSFFSAVQSDIDDGVPFFEISGSSLTGYKKTYVLDGDTAEYRTVKHGSHITLLGDYPSFSFWDIGTVVLEMSYHLGFNHLLSLTALEIIGTNKTVPCSITLGEGEMRISAPRGVYINGNSLPY